MSELVQTQTSASASSSATQNSVCANETLGDSAEFLGGAFTPPAEIPAAWKNLASAFLSSCAQFADKSIVTDTTPADDNQPDGPRKEMTAAQLAQNAMLLALALSESLKDAQLVAIIVPPSVPCPVINAALTLLGRVPVNLNFVNTSDVVNGMIADCHIQDVIAPTSLIEKLNFQLNCNIIPAESLKSLVRPDHVAKLIQAQKDGSLETLFPGLTAGLDDLATILFTTGSGGKPKAVEVTQRSILAAVSGAGSAFDLLDDETILGILPASHSFGFDLMWMGMLLGKRVVYHSNGTDIKTVCKLIIEKRISFMVSTPNYYRLYLPILERQKEKLDRLRCMVSGAAKLSPELAQDIVQRLSVPGRPSVEVCSCYGMTESCGIATFSVPREITLPSGNGKGNKKVWGNRPGSTGRAAPGTRILIVDLETRTKVLPPGEKNIGLIIVSGPQLMRSYRNQPEKTAAAFLPLGYITGDVGYLDEDGFLFPLYRLARFAKPMGDMVPMEDIQQRICQLVHGEAESQVFVVNIDDPKRVERIVVFYLSSLAVDPTAVTDALGGTMPNLWIPARGDFLAIEEMPLANGKIDVQKLRAIAYETLTAKG